MTNETESKSQKAAKKHFDKNENIQDLAVILKGEHTTWVSIHRRGEGQLLNVDVPSAHEDLEYVAQCLLRRFYVARTEIVYA
jgi:hypothetical protein